VKERKLLAAMSRIIWLRHLPHGIAFQ